METKIRIKNTRTGYGLFPIYLHWLVAAAFIANYALIYIREQFFERKDEFAHTLISMHTALGVSVLVFVVVRIVWRLTNTQPDDVPGSKLELFTGHTAHTLRYAAMITLPLIGYLGTGGPSQLFFVYELPPFKSTGLFEVVVAGWFGLEWDAFEGVMDFIHKQCGAYMVPGLILTHALAAYFHYLVRPENVLRRMVLPKG